MSEPLPPCDAAPDLCGAAAGEDCQPGCPSLASDEYPTTEEPTMDKITELLARLRPMLAEFEQADERASEDFPSDRDVYARDDLAVEVTRMAAALVAALDEEGAT